MEREAIFSAARVLLPHGVWLAPGALIVRGSRIEEIGEPKHLRTRSASAQRIDLGGSALLPGLVNAHAHLELTGLAGRLPRGEDFGAWVRGLVQARAQSSAAELEQAAISGARRCLAGGATTVGDLDATGCAESAFGARTRGGIPRIVQFRELLDARSPDRIAHELARLEAIRFDSEFHFPGLAPHAPHTVSPQLLQAIAGASRKSAIALTTHWAETQDETDWLETGRGPFAAMLGESPRRCGLDLLEDAGLLHSGLALVHGNLARPAEIARVARAGATLVHCPASHAFFERPAFDLRAWHAAGVAVALGTDSMASNTALDMRLELSRLAAAQPWLEARQAIDAATVHGARALGLQGRVGVIARGAFADLLAIPASETDGERLLARLARGEFDVLHMWLGGLAVPSLEHGAA